MSDKEKLPTKPSIHAIVAPTGSRGSLVGRALADLQEYKERALVSEIQDLRYRQARAVYEKQLANSNKTAWTAEQTTALVAAFETLRGLAVKGYGKAYFPLAMFYSSGWCIKKDLQQASHFFTLALEWCQANQAKAADQGDEFAQQDLGFMYGEGRGVAKDEAEAVKWYCKAADQGYALAQYSLGVMYGEGRGVAKDEAEAVKWYRKAAKQGYAPAHYNLGVTYAQGRGVAKDEAEAVTWYRKAADQGDAPAQSNLGVMYEQGRGVAKDEAEAVTWFRKAAEQGYDSAQFNLGLMYAQGRGVAKDEAEAVKWYRKAADQGHADAQNNLGFMYGEGWGVAKDEAEAVTRWATWRSDCCKNCLSGKFSLKWL